MLGVVGGGVIVTPSYSSKPHWKATTIFRTSLYENRQKSALCSPILFEAVYV